MGEWMNADIGLLYELTGVSVFCWEVNGRLWEVLKDKEGNLDLKS